MLFTSAENHLSLICRYICLLILLKEIRGALDIHETFARLHIECLGDLWVLSFDHQGVFSAIFIDARLMGRIWNSSDTFLTLSLWLHRCRPNDILQFIADYQFSLCMILNLIMRLLYCCGLRVLLLYLLEKSCSIFGRKASRSTPYTELVTILKYLLPRHWIHSYIAIRDA